MSTSENEARPDGRKPRRPWVVVLLALGVAVVLGLVAGGVWWGVAAQPNATGTSADSAHTSSPAPSGGTSSVSPAPATPGATPAPTAQVVAGAAGAALPLREPVAMKASTDVEKGVTVTMTSLESVKGEASGVGEVAGPAIRFTLEFTNSGDAAYPTQQIAVNTYYGTDSTPASTLSKPGAVPLPAAVPAHGSASATYVFTVPSDQRGSVVVTVDYQAGSPAIAFRGAAP